MAEAALAALPPAFHAAAEGVLVRVEELADDETLATLGLEDPYELTGLYDGRALTTRSTDDLPTLPDTVWLYRRAILDEWIARGDVTLGALVTHVLVHEIAHHLGWSDADIAAIDPWWT
ncbi:MAG: metallopeptidase family protein [Pseudomonadota bacterium]